MVEWLFNCHFAIAFEIVRENRDGGLLMTQLVQSTFNERLSEKNEFKLFKVHIFFSIF